MSAASVGWVLVLTGWVLLIGGIGTEHMPALWTALGIGAATLVLPGRGATGQCIGQFRG